MRNKSEHILVENHLGYNGRVLDHGLCWIISYSVESMCMRQESLIMRECVVFACICMHRRLECNYCILLRRFFWLYFRVYDEMIDDWFIKLDSIQK